MNTNITTIDTIDALGVLKAEIAGLLKQEKELKDRLGDLKPGVYDGDLYRLSISETTRETIDQDAIRAYAPAGWLRDNTRITEVRTLRVSARSSIKAVA